MRKGLKKSFSPAFSKIISGTLKKTFENEIKKSPMDIYSCVCLFHLLKLKIMMMIVQSDFICIVYLSNYVIMGNIVLFNIGTKFSLHIHD